MSVLKLDKNDFERTVGSGETVLLEFYAGWCSACRTLMPTVEKIAAENPQYRIIAADVDRQAELAGRFGIMSVPALVVFKDGKEVNRLIGMHTKAEILEALK